MEFETWLRFSAIWAVSLIGVGANMLICITAGATNGFYRGMWVACGVTAASVIHASIASFGAGAALTALSDAYGVMKWAAAAYLLVLAALQWRRVPVLSTDGVVELEGRVPLFLRGLSTSLANPQSYLWYLIFFVPFIDTEQAIWSQVLVLVPTAVAIAFIGFALYTALGLPIRRILTTPTRYRLTTRASALLLVVCAAFIAMTEGPGAGG